MPGASGASCAAAAAQRAPEHALDLGARKAARPQQRRLAQAGDDGRTPRRPCRARRRAPCRCARAGRPAHAPRWSARHGRSGWPTAPRSARRTPRAAPAPVGCAGTRTATLSSPASARSATGQSGSFGSTSVSGPGQNAAASFSAAASNAPSRRAAASVRHMGDQRVEGRPPLGGIEPGHRLALARVGAEPIDGLGREGDQPAGLQGSARPPRCRRDRPAKPVFPARRS